MVTENKRKGKVIKEGRTVSRKNYDLDYLFDYYYNARKAEGRASATLETYRFTYAGFCEYLDEKEIPRNIDSINAGVGRDYMIWLRYEKQKFSDKCSVPEEVKTVGLLPKSINTRIKNMKTMFKFLAETGVIESDPFLYVKPLPDVGRDIEILTIDEMKRLINVPNHKRYSQFRDYVILNLLIDGMLRVKEALTLRKQDIDTKTGVISLRREVVKTRKQRIVPITKRTAQLVEELIREVEDFESDYIFLSNYGELLTANQFRHNLRRYANEAGITKRVHPHLFRHTGATLFLEEGGSASHLQAILGHSDGRMTAHYTHLSDKSIKESHDKNSVANRLLTKHEKPRKVKR